MSRPSWVGIAAFAVLALALATAAPGAPVDLPEALRGTPADPSPGTFLKAEGAASVWVTLQALDAAQGFGTARAEGDGQPLAFRLLPYTSFRRFGSGGAEAAEFSPGERVQVQLVDVTLGHPLRQVSYALSVSDEITGQLHEGRAYRMQSQDRTNYRFTVEATGKTPPNPSPLTLAYGPETTLVLREAANHTFSVPPGTALWLNTGTRSDGTRVAREVLDEASGTRFRKQQELRLLARPGTEGAPAYLLAGNRERRARVFPDYSPWARTLKPGDEVWVAADGAFPGSDPPSARVASVQDADGAVNVTLQNPLLRYPPVSTVRLARPSGEVDYARDVRPMLEANCAACHGATRTDSGFSVASIDRMRAGGRRGPALVPGKSDESLLYLVVSGARGPHMPPDRDLTPAQLALLKTWIGGGAATGSQK